MNDCRRCRPLLAQAYYKELDATQQAWFDDHLKTCQDCAAEYREMVSVLEMMSRRTQQDPGEEFWNGYYARLQARMAMPPKSVPVARPVFGKWMLQAAAAIVFLALGLLIGKLYFSTPAPSIAVRTQLPREDVRAARFLQRSQVLLVGMIHMDTSTTLNPGELSRQREISHELIHEASYLQGELKDPRERRLQQLVSELQVILTEIANMEDQSDLQAVEMVKSGVDRKGILLRINLEQMRSSDQKLQGPTKGRF